MLIWQMHFDWGGTEEELKKLEKAYKETCDRVDKLEYLWLLRPWNKKFHYTMFLKMEDISQLKEFGDIWFAEHTRDYNKTTHAIYDFYS